MSASSARAGAVVALLVFAGCGGQAADLPRSGGPAPVAGPIGASQTTYSGEDGPRGTVTLAFAGDTHFQLHLAALLDRPRGALGPITRTLADADLTMVNLESAITEHGTPELRPGQLPLVPRPPARVGRAPAPHPQRRGGP